MDTKSKKFSDKMSVRVIAFLLCGLMFTLAITLSVHVLGKSHSIDTVYNGSLSTLFSNKGFEDSLEFQEVNIDLINLLIPLLAEYKSEQYIKSGKTITEARKIEIENEFFQNDGYNIYDERYGDRYVTPSENGPRVQTYQIGPVTMAQFREVNKEVLDQIIQNEIQEDLNSYKDIVRQLNSIKGLSYYASNGKNYITNIPTDSKLLISGAASVKEGIKNNSSSNFQAYTLFENGELTKKPTVSKSSQGLSDGEFKQIIENSLNNFVTEAGEASQISIDDYIIYYGFDKSYFTEKNESLYELKSIMKAYLPLLAVIMLACIALFIYLLVTTGRKDEAGIRKLYKLDKIFMEIQGVAIIVALYFGIVIFNKMSYGIGSYYNGFYNFGFYANNIENIIFGGLLAIPVALVGLWFILSVMRNLKAGLFLESCLTFRICRAIYRGLKSIFYGGSAMRKVVLITLGICLASATFFLAPVVFILVLIFTPKAISKYEAVRKGVKEVKSGNLTYKIPVEGDGEFDNLARDINEISEASNLAIQNELKNQRLKTDLISNVSHDLKTPLTSIITYIDLLKQEGLTCEEAPKYLDILDQKAARLKNLTEDLFEAAKASSGDIPVRLEKVDLMAVINQSLGEFSDRIDIVNLEFKVTGEQEKNYVNADRQLLWRVIENLLGNVVKYAQEGSRVYIDVKPLKNSSKKNMLVMEMKNISKTELNIHADELMERFKRGDESRTTEGSGLGLAIAKDLINLQNGWFELKIDGDLFKAVVLLEEAYV